MGVVVESSVSVPSLLLVVLLAVYIGVTGFSKSKKKRRAKVKEEGRPRPGSWPAIKESLVKSIEGAERLRWAESTAAVSYVAHAVAS